MGGWALLAGLAVVGYYWWNSSELSSNAPVSPSPVQGAKTMNVAYASPILLASVNGITFSASWSASAGSPVAGWIFAFAIDPNFTQSYVGVDLPANQTSVSNNQANSTYYFRIRFVDQNGVMSPWSNAVGPLTSGPAPAGAALSSAAPVVTAPVSATSTASNAPVAAHTMNVAYASPILLASVNGITFSASWSASAGSPVAGWIFAFAIDPNFTQSYDEVDLPANQTSVSNNQANSTYYFRIRFVDQNGVMSPWSNAVGPLTSGPAPAIPQVYEQSGPTTIAESGASTSEQAMQAQAVTSLVQTYSANLEVLIGQPVQFLQMVQQLFGGNPGLLDQVSDSVKAYFNQLVNNGPGGSISAYDLSNYYEAIAQHGAVQGPQVFAYWKANGMLSEPSLSGVDQYLVPATVLP
jgi:chitodextrinase